MHSFDKTLRAPRGRQRETSITRSRNHVFLIGRLRVSL